jgi:putative membrane protein
MNPNLSCWTAAAFVLAAFPFGFLRVEPGADARVVTFVHQANLRDIAQTRLAPERSESALVKTFAARAASDHTAADKQIKEFAASQHIKLDAGSTGTAPGEWTRSWESALPPAGESDRVLASLSSLQGAAFDREFMRVMVDDYQRLIDRLSAARAGPISLELRIGIDRALPAVRQQLQMAAQLRSNVATR